MLLSLHLLLTGTPASAGDYDRWYRVLMDDHPAGWMRITSTQADGQIVTSKEIVLKVRREGTPLSATLRTTFVETRAGRPVRMSSVMELGAAPVETQTVFTDTEARVTTTQSGRSMTTVEPAPSPRALGPGAMAEFFRLRLGAGAREISLLFIDPFAGPRPIAATYRDIQPARFIYEGREIPVFKAAVVEEGDSATTSTEWLDADGLPVRSTNNVGGLTMETVLAGESVRQEFNVAPELLTESVIATDRPINDPRALRQARYRLSVRRGELPDLPGTPSQRCLGLPDGSLQVIVNADARGRNEHAPDRPRYLEATPVIDCRDERIIDLARRAGATSPAQCAEQLRRIVRSHITRKDLTVGFATASQVARTGEGDCTEHAVLLAALLRARGIPSRVACGLIYTRAPGSSGFGYHMWTQALLPEADGAERWIDLDATLSGESAFDAAHIAISTTALDEPGDQAMITIAAAIGRIQISVEQP